MGKNIEFGGDPFAGFLGDVEAALEVRGRRVVRGVPDVSAVDKGKAVKMSIKAGKSSAFFPLTSFVRRGAKVTELSGGRWMVDFVRGKFVSSPVDEMYIHRILSECESPLVNQGEISWTVEEVQNGKFLIRRVI